MQLHSGHHHIEVRKRIYKKLEPFPHPRKLKRYFDHLMYVVAIGGPLSVLPQIIQTFQTRDVSGVSLSMWVGALFLTIIWLLYGVIHKETPIIVSQSVYVLTNIAMIGAILVYG